MVFRIPFFRPLGKAFNDKNFIAISEYESKWLPELPLYLCLAQKKLMNATITTTTTTATTTTNSNKRSSISLVLNDQYFIFF